MTRHRFFRSATHPEFLAYEVEPALVAAELPMSLAPVVGQLMDTNGLGMQENIAALKGVLLAYGASA